MNQKLDIFIYGEQSKEKPTPVTLEILGKVGELARDFGGIITTAVVVMGEENPECSQAYIDHGADEVITVVGLPAEPYCPHIYEEALVQLVKERRPDVFLFGATNLGVDLAAAVAARLGTGLAAHCIDLSFDDDGNLVQVVPAFGGRILSNIYCPDTKPAMATINRGIFSPPPLLACNREGIFSTFAPRDLDTIPTAQLLMTGKEEPAVGKEPLEQAEVIIAGGYGVGAENWPLLEELAALLGGAVGSTRPAIDEGWVEEDTMIGTSGKTVSPRVYVGFGISGATHHTIGMKDAGVVINVNIDPEAPAFDVSDWRVVADCGPILKELVAELKRSMEEGKEGCGCE
jgi:electron transfer flavoprotein alpha subunit